MTSYHVTCSLCVKRNVSYQSAKSAEFFWNFAFKVTERCEQRDMLGFEAEVWNDCLIGGGGGGGALGRGLFHFAICFIFCFSF